MRTDTTRPSIEVFSFFPWKYSSMRGSRVDAVKHQKLLFGAVAPHKAGKL